MRPLFTRLRSTVPHLAHCVSARWLVSSLGWVASAVVGLSALPVRAATPETAPAELTSLLDRIDAAANRKDANAVMSFYSPQFTPENGLTLKNMREALVQVWKRFSQITYDTQVVSWEMRGQTLVAETVTRISGMEEWDNRKFALTSTLRSRQEYVDGKIVSQEILSEDSQLTSGDTPPTLQVNLPDRVAPEQRYNFDAIVQEPLDSDFLIGTAIEEAVGMKPYLNPATVELEGLSSGGIFKLGRAPAQEGDYWLSAVVVRGSGIAIVTRRLQVER